MKNDWAFHLALLAGVLAMTISTLTFDHDKADRRESLAKDTALFEEGGYHDFSIWRRLRGTLWAAPSPEREVRWWASQVARRSALDAPAAEGAAWYWRALATQGNRPLDEAREDPDYREALARSLASLRESTLRTSEDPTLRYFVGHYAGRAAARLGDRGADAREFLSIAHEEREALADQLGPSSTHWYVNTLVSSWDMAGDRERAIEALQTTLRDAIERGTARFGRMGMRGSLLSGIPDGYDRDAVEIALPLIEAWLESNDHDPMGGRSWYALGWLCDSLERPEDARRAWSRSLADWEQLARETPGSGTLYNLACGYALLGQAEDALGALERAVDAGYMNTQHARYDRDFGSLNEDPRFEALLVRMDAIQRAYFEAQAEEDGPERASDAKP